MRNKIIHYYVEGENEKNFLDQIKGVYVQAGKVEVLNVVQNKISNARIRTIKPETIVVLVFDIDVENIKHLNTLQNNIKALKNSRHIKKVIIIPQVNNFQDELLYSTNIKKIELFVPSKSESEFKSDFNKLGKGIISRLDKYHFVIEKLWSKEIPRDNIYYNLDRKLRKPELIKISKKK